MRLSVVPKHTEISVTVNPFMFACPLFREFRDLNETAKLKGVNIDTVATSIIITHVLALLLCL